MYYATAHYDVINYTLHRRKRHFKDTVDSYKVINDVIIRIKIIYFPVIFFNYFNFNYSATI